MYLSQSYNHGQFQGLRALRGNYQEETPVQGFTISAGDTGIRQTCDFIRKQINLGKADAAVQAQFQQIALESHAKNKTELSQALTAWVVQNIHYTPDDDMSATEQGLKWINIHQCPMAYSCAEKGRVVTRHPQTDHCR